MKDFADIVTVTLISGKGGAGSVSFRREKYIPKGGPDGGDGGKGGNVIVRTSIHRRTLRYLWHKRIHKAQDGEHGKKRQKHGKDGDDLLIEVPLGTVIKDPETGNICAELFSQDDSIILLKGGKGGKGNVHFKSSTHQAPTYAQSGMPGMERGFVFELELYSDICFVGLPNVGKSTLLKALTNANPKIANYPFTTLIPNLGTLVIHNREIILSDIPGLIKGASEGRGLSFHFLRHIRRAACIAYVLDASPCVDKETVIEIIGGQYELVCKEISKYNDVLADKPILIIISKLDIALIDADSIISILQEYFKTMEIHQLGICAVSAYTMKHMHILEDMLYRAAL